MKDSDFDDLQKHIFSLEEKLPYWGVNASPEALLRQRLYRMRIELSSIREQWNGLSNHV